MIAVSPELREDTRRSSLVPLESASISEAVSERIRRAIIRGELQPGERLSEVDLGVRFNVSRSPVREAMHRLEGEGLIVSKSNHRSYVWEPTAKDVDEVLSLRVMIESLAAEWCMKALTDADFDALDTIVARQRTIIQDGGDVMALTIEDRRFHEYVCQRANHARLLEWWTHIMSQWEMLIYIRAVFNPPSVLDTILNDHNAVIDALRQRDLEGVVKLHRSVNARVSSEIKQALAARNASAREARGK